MRHMWWMILLCMTTLCAEEIKDVATGITFPAQVSFDYQGKTIDLTATGVATRKKFFVKVYSVASYLQKGTKREGDRFTPFLQGDVAKQLTLKWVHEVPADKVQEGYRESLGKIFSSTQKDQLQKEIEQYLSFFGQSIKKGDEHILRSLPDGTVDVIINGQAVGSIHSKEFAQGLWGVWFGPDAVVNREKLVSK